MKVRELIQHLQTCNPDLPVHHLVMLTLATNAVAPEICVVDTSYIDTDSPLPYAGGLEPIALDSDQTTERSKLVVKLF